MKKMALLFLLALPLAGCGTTFGRPQVRSVKPVAKGGARVVVQPANTRATYFFTNTEGKVFFCAEPAPDVALAAAAVASIKGSVNGAIANGDATASLNTTTTELTGRTQTVLLARDLLTNLCTMRANELAAGAAAAPELWGRFDNIVALIRDVLKIEQTDAETKKEEASVKAIAAKVSQSESSFLAVVDQVRSRIDTSVGSIAQQFPKESFDEKIQKLDKILKEAKIIASNDKSVSEIKDLNQLKVYLSRNPERLEKIASAVKLIK